MATLRGITVLELLNLPTGSSLIPNDIASQLDKLAVIDYHSTTSEGSFIHYGTIRSLSDMGLPSLRNWPVEVPGLNTGIHFQLTFVRATATSTQNLEPSPTGWHLDLFLDRVSIIIPGLKPAKIIGGSGTTPIHLEADGKRDRVRIYGSGVFRIGSNQSGGVDVRFIDKPDPFDPAAPTGTVFHMGFDPPSFFIGDSNYGLTVDDLTFDDSDSYTPPEVVAKGHDASWRGIVIKQATFYSPPNLPLVGDLSVGVKDVILGSPAGIQGELRVEFGILPTTATTLSFYQLVDGVDTSLGAAVVDASGGYKVTLASGTAETAQVHASLPTGITADWTLPDKRNSNHTNDSGIFLVHEGDTLTFRVHEVSQDGTDAIGPETSCTFVRPTASQTNAPTINVTVNSTIIKNVSYVGGTAQDLTSLSFGVDAVTTPTHLTWQFGVGGGADSTQGVSTYTLPMSSNIGRQDLVLTDANGNKRRVAIDVLKTGGLVFGCSTGVFDHNGAPITIRAIEGTYDLAKFNSQGLLLAAGDDASVNSGTLTVPSGDLAQVSLEIGSKTGPDSSANPAPPLSPANHVQVLMVFDRVEEWLWGDFSPPNVSGAFSIDALRQWASSFTNAQFLIIGRCCDIGSQSVNFTLAEKRATEGNRLLTDTSYSSTNLVDSSKVFSRGEQSVWPSGSQGPTLETASNLGPNEINGKWLIKLDHPEYLNWDPNDRDLPPRPEYRRIDIYAVMPTPDPNAPLQPDDTSAQDPSLRRALVPGADKSVITIATTRDPSVPYRVLLVVKWDSPTVVDLSDAIPTLADLTISWQSNNVSVPGASNLTTKLVHDDSATTPEIWTIKAHLAYDARTGQTLITLELDKEGDPDKGIGHLTSDTAGMNFLASVLAFGPALMAGISAAGIDGAAVRISALIAIGAFAAKYATQGNVVLHGIRLEDRQRSFSSLAGSRQRILVDYSVSLGFDADAGPIHVSSSKPLRIRYKQVGVELDNSKSGIDKLGLVFDDMSFDIEDAGQWKIDGPAGELLRVVGSRTGSGSTWFEIDLKFALDLGVVTITGATLRLTFDGSGGVPSIEIRGLSAKANIPGVLSGSGDMTLTTTGFSADLDIQVIPAKVEAKADFVMDTSSKPPMVALEVGVMFAVGIPLANTGLGLFGFLGRFVSNGKRTLQSTSADPIQKEIDWYHDTLAKKYGPHAGSWALGLGAVVGTMPDSAFTFNALGSLCIDFPDVSVVFGIDAHFVSQPKLPDAEDDGSQPPATSLTLLGLIAVDKNAVKIGIRGKFEMPKVIDLSVPINAYFPLPGNTADYYLRVGADNTEGRIGPPVTATILPGTLDLQAWTYLMIEENKLHSLGGDPSINLDGFAIGFGAGFEINLSAGPLKLDISALILLGVGTKPLLLIGEIEVKGELSLVVVSISVDGSINLKLRDDEQRLDGHFCGSVHLFFFSIKGCVDMSIGSNPSTDIPVPSSPLLGIDLTDRRAIITGSATNSGVTGIANTVWPDTVPVLHFSHYVSTMLASTSAFHPSPEVPGPDWNGTTELKYAYRLVGVDILDSSGTVLMGPLDSAWWLPSSRPGLANSDGPSASPLEGRELALLCWHPAPWARNLSDDGNQAPGDPANTISQACDASPQPSQVCVLGKDAVPDGPGISILSPEKPSDGPFPSYFQILGDQTFQPLDLELVESIVSQLGAYLVPANVDVLKTPYTSSNGTTIYNSYRLTYIGRYGKFLASAPFVGTFAPQIVNPELILAICIPDLTENNGGTMQSSGCTESKGGTMQCSDFTSFKSPVDLPQNFEYENVTYTSLGSTRQHLIEYRLSNEKILGLLINRNGLIAKLPYAVDSVIVDILVPKKYGKIKLSAFGINGTLLHTVDATGGGVFTVSAPGISYLEINVVESECLLLSICYSTTPHHSNFTDLISNQKLSSSEPYGKVSSHATDLFPLVTGYLNQQDAGIVWKPEMIGIFKSSTGECAFIRYTPSTPGPWTRFHISTYLRAPVGIVSCCGITWQAAYAQVKDQQARIDTQNTWNTRSTNVTPTQYPILKPGTPYQIRVQCQYAGWKKTSTDPQPPPIDNVQWQSLPDQLYSFTIASEPTTLPSGNVNFRDESVFDARAVARYIINFDPDGSGPPHFLDDPLAVNFSVDHLEQLLNLYNRTLQLKVRRTDLAAGTLSSGKKPPVTPCTIKWKKIGKDLMDPSDLRMVEAAESSACMSPASLGGSTAVISADLEPDADYDLLLVAAPSGTPDSNDVLIARCHFHTSRYHNSSEMLSALGFTGTTFAILPHDAILANGVMMPTDTPPASDQSVDCTLESLGLDPWPLTSQPRTVAIWSQVSDKWMLAGLMIETDESLVRTGRLSVVGASIAGSNLTPIRTNSAGTRVLLSFSNPVSIPMDSVLTLTLNDAVNGMINGNRRMAEVPCLVYQETL